MLPCWYQTLSVTLSEVCSITRTVSSIAGRKYLRCSSQYTSYSEDTGSIKSIPVSFNAPTTSSMRTNGQTNYCPYDGSSIPQYIKPQIIANTGSLRNCCEYREHLQYRTPKYSSGSINVQDPKYCEDTRNKGSIEQRRTASTRSMSSIGAWNIVTRYSQCCLLYTSPSPRD